MTNSKSILKLNQEFSCLSITKWLITQLKIGRRYEGLIQRKINIKDFQMYKTPYMIHKEKLKLRL